MNTPLVALREFRFSAEFRALLQKRLICARKNLDPQCLYEGERRQWNEWIRCNDAPSSDEPLVEVISTPYHNNDSPARALTIR